MKRTLLGTCLAFLLMTAYAQENSYIVKTNGVLTGTQLTAADQEEDIFLYKKPFWHTVCSPNLRIFVQFNIEY